MSRISRALVITIDGPAGSGKSTVARNLARKLGFIHLNSGALFRALGLEAERRGLPIGDDDKLSALAQELKFQYLVNSDGTTAFLVNGTNWDDAVSSRVAGELATRVAVLPKVRQAFVDVQREVFAAVEADPKDSGGLVLEGRDAGTVVFPNADAKFYLEADLDVRAKRRFEELRFEELRRQGSSDGAGNKSLLAEIKAEIAARDHRDSTRAVAPQVRAEDALLIDTSVLDIDQVVTRILDELKQMN